LIDRRELFKAAREKGLGLGITEKDYVLGWLMFGLSQIKGIIFTGGTALSKIYFPMIWRLSEDLDFISPTGDFSEVKAGLPDIFSLIEHKSGIKLRLKSIYENPFYLQLKIQYSAVLGKNWAKVDITRDLPGESVRIEIPPAFSDYPKFLMKVETIESILAGKLRALLQRRKCRDYYDVWRIMGLKIDLQKTKEILERKCNVREVEIDIDRMFPGDLLDILRPYWERELGRLLRQPPEMEKVIDELRSKLHRLLCPVS